jgi:hypothetical protein
MQWEHILFAGNSTTSSAAFNSRPLNSKRTTSFSAKKESAHNNRRKHTSMAKLLLLPSLVPKQALQFGVTLNETCEGKKKKKRKKKTPKIESKVL